MSIFGIMSGGFMTVRYKNSFQAELLDYIEKLPGNIVLRKDIISLNEPRQISRALKALVEDKKLIKLGLGVYAKARESEYLDVPVIRVGFTEACIEVLNRFQVDWEPSQAIKDYNSGKTQQVPARFEVRLKSRFRRKIAEGNRKLRIEGMIYAK
jgi:hypothetical protein